MLLAISLIVKVVCLLLGLSLVLASEGGRGDKIGLSCSSNRDCLDYVNGSLCDISKQCLCSNDTPVFINETTSNLTKCFQDVNLDESGCDFTLQCNHLVNYTECTSGKCVCQKNYLKNKEKLCQKEERNSLIPIIVGSMLAVTILGTLAIYFYRSRGQTAFSST